MPENLDKMRLLMDGDGYVPLMSILALPKIQELTSMYLKDLGIPTKLL